MCVVNLQVSTYRGMWGGISGGVEGAERLVDRAMLEVSHPPAAPALIQLQQDPAAALLLPHRLPVGIYADQAPLCLQVLEEAGIPQHQLQLVCCGRPLPVVDGHRHFLVHPFLYDLVPGASDAVTLNWENTAHRWVTPG
jgi:hypothetical protein